MADFELISSKIFRILTIRSTCSISFASMIAYFGSPCAISISTVATMYASSFLISKKVSWSTNFFLIVVSPITSLTICLVSFYTAMMPQRCFREEHFSGGKCTPRVRHKVIFGTPNSPRRSL